MSYIKKFIDSFDPSKLQEKRSFDAKLKPDDQKCYRRPQKDKITGCNHPDCLDLRKAEMAADFSQFANSDGGYLVFGIRENNGEFYVAGIEEEQIKTIQQHIENILKSKCEPVPLFVVDSFKYQDKAMLLYWVFPSAKPVWTKWPRDTVKLIRRIDESKLALGPLQIEEFIGDMSRTNEIRIKTMFNQQDNGLSTDIELIGGVIETYESLIAHSGGYGGGGDAPRFFPVEVDRFMLLACNDDDFEIGFEARKARGSWRNQSLRLPYSLINHVWRTTKGQIGLILERQIIVAGSEISIGRD